MINNSFKKLCFHWNLIGWFWSDFEIGTKFKHSSNGSDIVLLPENRPEVLFTLERFRQVKKLAAISFQCVGTFTLLDLFHQHFPHSLLHLAYTFQLGNIGIGPTWLTHIFTFELFTYWFALATAFATLLSNNSALFTFWALISASVVFLCSYTLPAGLASAFLVLDLSLLVAYVAVLLPTWSPKCIEYQEPPLHLH